MFTQYPVIVCENGDYRPVHEANYGCELCGSKIYSETMYEVEIEELDHE
jgi:hypothetical protein